MRKGLLFIVAMLAMAGIVKADEMSDLKKQLAEQQKLLMEMQQKLAELDSKQQAQDAQIDQKIEEATEEKMTASLPESLKWAEKIKWSGDFRYRHESIDDDTKDSDRDRNRIRARIKMQAEVNEEWDAYFRIATGSSDSPTSTNHTLGDSDGDGFSSRDLWLDWAYADYHPTAVDGLNVQFGKMGYPFYRVAKHQVMIDGDVSPEGIAAKYAWDIDESTTANITGAGFWVRERSDDADTSFWGIQGLLKHKFDSGNHILGGLSYYDFGNIQGKSLSGVDSKGNSVTQVGDDIFFDSDYDLLELFGEYGFKAGNMPVTVYGTYFNNTACINDQDTAWLIGCKFNKAKKPGSWEAFYNYRDIESDAVVGGLNDSDFIGGGTNGKGHVFGGKYQISKNVQAGLKYFVNTKNADSTEDDFTMLQADLMVKF